MTLPKSVLGCAGLCWVAFGNPAQVEAFNGGPLRGLCWVCWVCTRAHACAFKRATTDGETLTQRKILYARTQKPNTPNTLNTDSLKVLIYKDFKCVGFVLGWAFCVGLLRIAGVLR
jgi:hypothetical protein